MRRIRIHSHFLVAEDRELLRQCFQAVEKRKSGDLHVRALGRLGATGARLLLVHFDKQRKTLPRVIKIHTKTEIKREIEAIESVRGYFIDVNIGNIQAEFHKKYGALIYLYLGSKKIVEFRDLAYDPKFKLTSLRTFLERMYLRCRGAHEAASPKEVNLLKYYRRKKYLRGRSPKKNIAWVLGRHKNEKVFEFLGEKILNPLIALQKFDKTTQCRIGPVHGDLHPNNVILGFDGQPYLIDFAWANKTTHILVDFLLLENSLRFLLLPHKPNLYDQLKVDRCLLDENGYQQIRGIGFKLRSQRDSFVRLAAMVEMIREMAKAVNAFDDFDEYLASQFLILYGLLKYNEYNIYPAVRALGMIAKRLADSKFLS